MLRRWTTVLGSYLLIFVYFCALLSIPTTQASSNSLVIYQVQTGGTNAATQEFISLFNNSSNSVDISDWCVVYVSSSNITQTQLGCFRPPAQTKLLMPTHSYVTLASSDFVLAHTGFVPDLIFSPGISGTSGHIKILDDSKIEMDKLGWGSASNPEGQISLAHSAGKILQRNATIDGRLQDEDNNSTDFQQIVLSEIPNSSLEEETIPIDVCLNIPDLQSQPPEGYLIDTDDTCQLDVCINLENLQRDVPDGYVSTIEGACDLLPVESAVIEISELLPNKTGSDTGGEFIELFNPNNRDVLLKGYVLQTGTNFSKSYNLPDILIASMQYLALSDTQTGLVLPNTTGILRLLAPNGAVVSATAEYNNPKDDESWARIGDNWYSTYTPTPDALNMITKEKPCATGESRSLETGQCSLDDVADDTELTPCRVDQERNPNTNRCRLLQVSIAGLSVCKLGQERNPETNRCRSVDLANSSNLVPCKEGQERNPETNRCRNIVQPAILGACDEGEARNPETNRCRKSAVGESAQLAKVQDVADSSIARSPKWWLIGASIIGALGYAVYEWRNELTQLFKKYAPSKFKI